MADEDDLNPDQEYQFSDSGEQTDYTDEPALVDPTKKSTQMRKIVLWVVGILIILFALYQLFGGSSSTIPEPEVKPPPVIVPTMPSNNVQTSTRLEQQVQTLVSTTRQNQLDIGNIRSLITELQNSMDNLSARLIDNQSAMQSLEKKWANQPKPLVTKAVLKRPVPVKKKRSVKKVRIPPPPAYYIQAVIPGRAWIQSKDGKVLTVSEGEHLRGYGAIKKIDAMQGKIYTSYGRVIQFSPDEV